jgi:hypothetical protein
MEDLRLPRGYVIHPGRERYSLGHRVIAIPAAHLLSQPESVAAL